MSPVKALVEDQPENQADVVLREGMVRDLFVMLHFLSGTVSSTKLDHQPHSHLLNHLKSHLFKLSY